MVKNKSRFLCLIMALVITFTGVNVDIYAEESGMLSLDEKESTSFVADMDEETESADLQKESESENNAKEKEEDSQEGNKEITEEPGTSFEEEEEQNKEKNPETEPEGDLENKAEEENSKQEEILTKEDKQEVSNEEEFSSQENPNRDKQPSLSDNDIESEENEMEQEASVSDNEIQLTVSANDIYKSNLSEEEWEEKADLLDLELIPIEIDEEEAFDPLELFGTEEMPSLFSLSYGLYGDEYTSYYIYNQLDEETRAVWTAMETLYSEYLENNTTFQQNYAQIWKMKTNGKSLSEMMDLLMLFRYTHPQYYYLSNAVYYNDKYQPGDEYVYLGFGIYQKFKSGTVRRETTEEILSLIEEWKTDIEKADTEEDKIKVIHDKICNKVDYNKPVTADKVITSTEEETHFTQSAYSVFCKDLTVCAGYTQTFTWLCNAVNIDAFGVTSPGHAWNKVKVNGEWYNIDCTWDDEVGAGNINYKYYLRNDRYYDTDSSTSNRANHQEEWQWESYLPECTLDSGSGTNSAGKLPTVSARTETPVIRVSQKNEIRTVTLSCATQGAKIYYTTDGKTPNEAGAKSYLYRGPLEFTDTREIKAIAVSKECLDSQIVRGTTFSRMGSCDSDLLWELDPEGVLTVNGTGAMADFKNREEAPWYPLAEEITEIIIKKGVTKIGAYAFDGYDALTKISIPKSVTEISAHGFSDNVDIWGYPDSSAENYAGEHGNKFVDIRPYKIKVEFETGTDDVFEPQYLDIGEPVEVVEEITKEGYTLEGWYPTNDAQAQTEPWDFSTHTVTENMTLYAKWNPNVYKVYFDTMGGYTEEELKEVTYNSIYGTLPTPRKSNYIFEGWYTNQEAGSKIEEQTSVKILSDQTLYAHWRLKYKTETPTANIPTGSEVKKGSFVELNSATSNADIYYILVKGVSAAAEGYGKEGVLEDRITEALLSDEEDTKTEKINILLQHGFLYENNIEITEPITIYATAVKEEHENSDVLQVSYLLKDESLDWEDLGNHSEDLVEAKEKFKTESAAEIPEKMWIAGLQDFTYTGKAITQPSLRVYFCKTLLNPKTDYTVKYQKNTKAGTAEMVITGKGNYAGTITETFEILPLDLSEAKISEEKVLLPYNGQVQKATVNVTYTQGTKTITLKKGVDYVYSYEKEEEEGAFQNPGSYTVKIIGQGNYSGSRTFLQEITNKTLLSEVSLGKIPNQSYDYINQQQVQPEPVLKKDGVTLVNGRDYTLSYENNDKAGTATVIITATEEGDYIGTVATTFKITGTALNRLKISGFKSSLMYHKETPTKQEITLTHTLGSGDNPITKELVEGEDYSVTYQNNDKAGTATVTYTGMGGYTGTLKKTFKIVGQSIAKAQINNFLTTMEYQPAMDGSEVNMEQNCQLVIADGEGNFIPLKEGEDYTVTYRNHQKAGKATMIIRGLGGYSGIIQKTYRITSVDLAAFATEGKIMVSGMDQPYAYVKGGVMPKPEIVYEISEGNYVPLTEGKDYTLKYSNYKTIRTKDTVNAPVVKIIGKGNYKGSVTKTFTITNADIRETKMQVKDLIYRNRANIFRQSIALYDVNKKKLTAGTDYEKTITYRYAKDTVVTQVIHRQEKTVIRLEGEMVEREDILPVGARIQAIATGKNFYLSEDPSKNNKSEVFRVVAADMSSAKVKIASQPYKGKPVSLHKSDITITINGTILKPTEYDIIGYSNNHKTGTAKVILAGKGNYGGEKTFTFKIIKYN